MQSALSSYNSITPIKFTILFTNNLGAPIYFPSNTFNATLTNVGSAGINSFKGNCTPQIAPAGGLVTCVSQIPGTIVPATGTQASAQFVVNYSICKNTQLGSCSGNYRTTGFSLQSLSPP